MKDMFLALARYDLDYCDGDESIEEYVADLLEQLYEVCPDTKASLDETIALLRAEQGS